MKAGIRVGVLLLAGGVLLAGCEKQPDKGAQSAALENVKPTGPRPNIIVFSIDTLRPDHLGCYGYARATSPNIDAFAGEGALFENAISASSWTLPAHASLFTGVACSVHGCTNTDRRLHDKYYTLAERLRDAGYATVGFFSGPYLHPVFGLDQGFDQYIDCTSYAGLMKAAAEKTGTVEGSKIWEAMDRDITNPRVLEAVQKWLAGNERKPFFMFIHMWDVHFDFIPPPPFDKKFDPDYTGPVTGERFFFDPKINKDMPRRDLEHLIALYDGEIAWTDMHFGKIIDDLRSRGLLDSSVVIVTADHGTAFFEHGLKGHRNTLFDELIRVPLIVRFPRRVPAGLRIAQQARMVDILPTVLDLADFMPPRLMGQSLAPLFAGGKTDRDDPAISELDTWGHHFESFRRLERKIVWDLSSDRGAVFDLEQDPTEHAAVRDKRSPVVRACIRDLKFSRGLLKRFRERYPRSPKISDLPDELFRKLESLGYVGGARSEPEPSSAPAP